MQKKMKCFHHPFCLKNKNNEKFYSCFFVFRTYGAVQFLGNIQCRMFPGSDWATTLILVNISDSLGDIERVKTQ